MTGVKGRSGGKREGAKGAPTKYGEPTVMLSIRVPASMMEQLKAMVNKQIAKRIVKKR